MLTPAPGPRPAPPDTYLSAQFWRLAVHSILVVCWHLLTNDCDYDDLGGDYFARRGDTVRHQERLVQQLEDLGSAVTLRNVA